MIHVRVRPNESRDRVLKRFRKKVTRSGLLSKLRRKRWHMSKGEVRRLARKKAIRRQRRRERKRKQRDARRRW